MSEVYKFTVRRRNGKIEVTDYEQHAGGINAFQYSGGSDAEKLVEECKGLVDILHKNTVEVRIKARND